MTQEALKLALEALEELYNTNSSWWKEVDEQTIKKIENSITAIKEALAQTQEPEPVADDIASILACRDMLDAQPVPPRTEQLKACVYCGQLVAKEKNT